MNIAASFPSVMKLRFNRPGGGWLRLKVMPTSCVML
jgi:hypothetical protein